MNHGEKGKRKRLADSFKAEIAELVPDVEPILFVNRAFAYCSKHSSNSRRR